jgi:hypothetical protein
MPSITTSFRWGFAKLVKASDFDSDMHRFESYIPCQLFKVLYVKVEWLIPPYPGQVAGFAITLYLIQDSRHIVTGLTQFDRAIQLFL